MKKLKYWNKRLQMNEMMKSATNSVKLGELMVKKDETEKALEEKMDRWVYLNDLNERILNGE